MAVCKRKESISIDAAVRIEILSHKMLVGFISDKIDIVIKNVECLLNIDIMDYSFKPQLIHISRR